MEMPSQLATGPTPLHRIDDFYRMDFEEGVISARGIRGRAFIIPTFAWATLRVSLTKTFKRHAKPLMLQMGYSVGTSFVAQARKLQGKPAALVRILLTLAKTSGWGEFMVKGDTGYGAELEVITRNCPFCQNEASSEVPVCHFLLGFVHGLIDALYGGIHAARETSCVSMGDAECVITIRKIPTSVHELPVHSSF